MILIILLVLLTTLINPSVVGQVENAPINRQLSVPYIQVKQLDGRAKILADYFAKYNSPLEYQAQDFIDAADQYGVDWKLVPAISGVESTFGKQSFGYNAWGWGIYGDQTLNFGSWRDGIFTVTGGLKQNYIDQGLTEPFAMNRAYAASPTWGTRVNYFMNDLDRFGNQYQKDIKPTNPQVKIAAQSARLAFENQ